MKTWRGDRIRVLLIYRCFLFLYVLFTLSYVFFSPSLHFVAYRKIPVISPSVIAPYPRKQKITSGYKPPLCWMTVLNRAKCCIIMTFELKNVFRSTLPWLVSKRFFFGPLISPSVYKPTQNPGLITGILRYSI